MNEWQGTLLIPRPWMSEENLNDWQGTLLIPSAWMSEVTLNECKALCSSLVHGCQSNFVPNSNLIYNK